MKKTTEGALYTLPTPTTRANRSLVIAECGLRNQTEPAEEEPSVSGTMPVP